LTSGYLEFHSIYVPTPIQQRMGVNVIIYVPTPIQQSRRGKCHVGTGNVYMTFSAILQISFIQESLLFILWIIS